MRDFNKVSPSVWDSSRFRSLPDDDARYVYVYLLTSKHQNSAGAFGLPRGYALVDLGWEGKRFDKARDALVASGMIDFDAATEEYRICRWFRHNPPMNAKHRIGIVSSIERLESDVIQEAALSELEADCPDVSPTKQASGRNLAGQHPNNLLNTKFLNGANR
jgi:hypothetical protein